MDAILLVITGQCQAIGSMTGQPDLWHEYGKKQTGGSPADSFYEVVVVSAGEVYVLSEVVISDR